MKNRGLIYLLPLTWCCIFISITVSAESVVIKMKEIEELTERGGEDMMLGLCNKVGYGGSGYTPDVIDQPGAKFTFNFCVAYQHEEIDGGEVVLTAEANDLSARGFSVFWGKCNEPASTWKKYQREVGPTEEYYPSLWKYMGSNLGNGDGPNMGPQRCPNDKDNPSDERTQ